MSVTLTTNLGDIKIELACQQVPRTCKNFLALCASGYYNGCKFHRNIRGFAIQGGDPTGTGKGGESIYGKYFEDEFDTNLKHDRRGIVAMANQGFPNSNGSQFFVTYSRQPHLNGTFAVFGRLVDGLDTLDKMEKEPVGKKNRPLRDIIIQSVTVHANPIAEDDDKSTHENPIAEDGDKSTHEDVTNSQVDQHEAHEANGSCDGPSCSNEV